MFFGFPQKSFACVCRRSLNHPGTLAEAFKPCMFRGFRLAPGLSHLANEGPSQIAVVHVIIKF